MSDLTYEQKFAACQALAGCSVRMRKPGDWYIDQAVEVKSGDVLEGRYGNGTDPIRAIHDHWECLTVLGDGEYLVSNAGSERRIAVKWNGFMWEAVSEKVTS